ncbi:MAG TPA: hypothetical protein PKY59_06195 [Pyrinomonadaceae bacterium]|nr:hypothetical protein [Pyrinomonadaceae bacterium]
MKTKFSITFIAIFLTLIFSISTVFAQAADDKCAIEAWGEDKELHKDIFIHETPSPLGKKLGEFL